MALTKLIKIKSKLIPKAYLKANAKIKKNILLDSTLYGIIHSASIKITSDSILGHVSTIPYDTKETALNRKHCLNLKNGLFLPYTTSNVIKHSSALLSSEMKVGHVFTSLLSYEKFMEQQENVFTESQYDSFIENEYTFMPFVLAEIIKTSIPIPKTQYVDPYSLGVTYAIMPLPRETNKTKYTEIKFMLNDNTYTLIRCTKDDVDVKVEKVDMEIFEEEKPTVTLENVWTN